MIIVDCRYKIPDCGELGPLRYVVAKPVAVIVPLKQALHPVLLILDDPFSSFARTLKTLNRGCGGAEPGSV